MKFLKVEFNVKMQCILILVLSTCFLNSLNARPLAKYLRKPPKALYGFNEMFALQDEESGNFDNKLNN